MVVKGYGGIGKTTLVKQFLDNINKADPNIGLMFIDSTEIIDSLTKAARAEKKLMIFMTSMRLRASEKSS